MIELLQNLILHGLIFIFGCVFYTVGRILGTQCAVPS